jgi:hypothetical protein
MVVGENVFESPMGLNVGLEFRRCLIMENMIFRGTNAL